MLRIFFVFGGLFTILIAPAMDNLNSTLTWSISNEIIYNGEYTVTYPSDTIPARSTMHPDSTAGIPQRVDTLLNQADTLGPEPIVLQPLQASVYIDSIIQDEQSWRPGGDSMKHSLQRLLDHYREPVDSVIKRLEAFNFEAMPLEQTVIFRSDTLPLRWLNDSSFYVDTVSLLKEPFLVEKTILRNGIDSTLLSYADSIPLFKRMVDSLLNVADTITRIYIDTTYLSDNGIQLHTVKGLEITPPLLPTQSRLITSFINDSSALALSESRQVLMAGRETPFYIVPGEQMPDSLRAAINSLQQYTDKRDSVLVYINDMHGVKTPFWLTSDDSELYRFWIKNYKNDSITVWMGNPEKDEITLFLEEEVNIDRLEIEPAAEIPVAMIKPEQKLVKVEPLKVIPVYWQYDLSTAIAFNQTYLSNWSKGGENSVATMLDIKGQAKYTDKEAKIEWTSNGRLKYGSIITEEYGLRTNTDQLEFNSQFNKVIKDKIDFSSVFYMKNQLARGYNYPNDSVIVSKFLNPGTFTLGVGIEYKPFKKTVINYSPLSYKNTFVLDTSMIDQTSHGIEADRKVRQEMGGQLVVKNKISIFNDIEMNNSLRLFSNYFDNPLNVDVDWEVNLEKRINWYFTVNLNLHLIYDDDIRFPVLGENDIPLKWPDGSVKKAPKMQFKEFVGLTFSFKF